MKQPPQESKTNKKTPRQVSIAGTEKVVSGCCDLGQMEDAQLLQVVEETTIFGRISPQ